MALFGANGLIASDWHLSDGDAALLSHAAVLA